MSSKSRLLWLDAGRVVACLAVVLLHVSSQWVKRVDTINTADWFVANVFDSVTRWSVPFFIVASGYLLLSQRSSESTVSFYHRRLINIVPALLFWCLVYFGYWVWGRGASVTPMSMFMTLISDQPFEHLYFLFLLLELYLVTPLLRNWIKTVKFSTVIMVAAVWLLGGWLGPRDRLVSSLVLQFGGYYLWGYVLSQLKFKNAWLWPGLAIVLIALIASMTTYLTLKVHATQNLAWYDFSHPAVWLLTTAVFIAFRQLLNLVKFQLTITTAASLTLGVFLLHPLLVFILEDLVVPQTLLPVALIIPLETGLVFVGCSALIYAARRVPAIKYLV